MKEEEEDVGQERVIGDSVEMSVKERRQKQESLQDLPDRKQLWSSHGCERDFGVCCCQLSVKEHRQKQESEDLPAASGCRCRVVVWREEGELGVWGWGVSVKNKWKMGRRGT